MAKKATGPEISTIAARVLATDNPFDEHKGAIAIAIQQCGLPLSAKAVNVFVERISEALAPLLTDMRSLAASALSQDETAYVPNKRDRPETLPVYELGVEAPIGYVEGNSET